MATVSSAAQAANHNGSFPAQWTVTEKPVTRYGNEHIFTAVYSGSLSMNDFKSWWKSMNGADLKAQAEQMKLKAQEEGARQADTILKKSEADTASQKERVKSAIDLQRRTRLLEAKQEMIAEIIEKAYEKVINLAPDDYYQMLLSILEAYILPQEGEIYFSVKDLENMPVGFGKEIEEIALAKGGKLTVAGAGRDNIDNGFILAYGGIEENCTIRAMFDAKRDELSDIVHRLLFV